ncbi:MAG: hypothetical protein RL748_2123, partial [Pseudomonadota bacterium]
MALSSNAKVNQTGLGFRLLSGLDPAAKAKVCEAIRKISTLDE